VHNFIANFVRILGICKDFAVNHVNSLGNPAAIRIFINIIQLTDKSYIISVYFDERTYISLRAMPGFSSKIRTLIFLSLPEL